MKKILNPFIFILAFILVFEEWIWDTLKAQVHKLSGLPIVAAFERALRSLSPAPALIILLIPFLVLFPFKLAGLYAISQGHGFIGVLVFIAAKIVGTGSGAYLFDLVRDSARKIYWFDRFYCFVMKLIFISKEWLESHPVYIRTQALIQMIKIKLSARSLLKRKLRAAKALLRK